MASEASEGVIIEIIHPNPTPNWTHWRECVHRAFMNSLLVHMEDTRNQGVRLRRLMDAHHSFLLVAERITELQLAVGSGRTTLPCSLAQLQLVMTTSAEEIQRLMQMFGDRDPLDIFIFHYEAKSTDFFHFNLWTSYDLGFSSWDEDIFMTYLCLQAPDACQLGRIFQCLLSLHQALDSILDRIYFSSISCPFCILIVCIINLVT